MPSQITWFYQQFTLLFCQFFKYRCCVFRNWHMRILLCNLWRWSGQFRGAMFVVLSSICYLLSLLLLLASLLASLYSTVVCEVQSSWCYVLLLMSSICYSLCILLLLASLLFSLCIVRWFVKFGVRTLKFVVLSAVAYVFNMLYCRVLLLFNLWRWLGAVRCSMFDVRGAICYCLTRCLVVETSVWCNLYFGLTMV